MSAALMRTERVGRALRATGVHELATATQHPCISILMPTEPAEAMLRRDVERLHELAADVDRQLGGRGVGGRLRLLRRLAELVQRAAGEPTDRGLALYLNPEVSRLYRLPAAVPVRSLVERTFSNRMLLTTLGRTPPYLLLVLQPGSAHLSEGRDEGQGRRPGSGTRGSDSRGTGAAGAVPRQLWRGADGTAAKESIEDFLARVDRVLGTHRAEHHPSPLVLAGNPEIVDRFCATSRHLERLAGRLPADTDHDASSLAEAAAGEVRRYLQSRRDDAMAQLTVALASRSHAVARGIEQCWDAAHRRRPGMLLVEADFVHPRRWRPPPTHGSACDPDGRPVDGSHDHVAELLDLVVLRGGQVALVEPGDLVRHGHVALISWSSAAGHPAETHVQLAQARTGESQRLEWR